MATLPILIITLLATVTCRNIPNGDYVPSKEQLDLIFGMSSPNQAKAPALETSAAAQNASMRAANTLGAPLMKGSNESKIKTPELIELDSEINENVSDKQSVVISDKDNKNLNSTAVSDKNVNKDAGKGVPKVDGQVDDRFALEAASCLAGMTRVGNTCIAPI